MPHRLHNDVVKRRPCHANGTQAHHQSQPKRHKRHACHAKCYPIFTPATQTAAAFYGTQARHQNQPITAMRWMSPSAAAQTAAETTGPKRASRAGLSPKSHVTCPRLPQKVGLDFFFKHACHANSHGDTQASGGGSPHPCWCHACHAKCCSMSSNPTPALDDARMMPSAQLVCKQAARELVVCEQVMCE